MQATIYRAGSQHRNERQRRSACLEALVADNATVREGVHLVLDEDETTVKFDNQMLIEYTRAAGCRDTLHYRHQQPHTEPLLAIPDAIAWCWAKGGHWRSLISPAIVSTRERFRQKTQSPSAAVVRPGLGLTS